MSKITVTADEGVRAVVRVQKLETHTQNIPEVKDSAGAVVAPSTSRSYDAWAVVENRNIASEAATFEVGKGVRLLVEEQS